MPGYVFIGFIYCCPTNKLKINIVNCVLLLLHFKFNLVSRKCCRKPFMGIAHSYW